MSFVILTLVIYKIKENCISKFKIKKYKLLFVIIISRSFTIINWFKTIQVHRSKYASSMRVPLNFIRNYYLKSRHDKRTHWPLV